MEITAAQREKDLLILNSLASKSKLTEKDVKEISNKIKSSVSVKLAIKH